MYVSATQLHYIVVDQTSIYLIIDIADGGAFENLNIPRDPRRKKVLTTAPIKKAFRKALG